MLSNNWYKKQLQGIILLLQTAPRDRECVFGDYRTSLQIQRICCPQVGDIETNEVEQNFRLSALELPNVIF
jgi:hypothetical protein